MNPTTTIVPAGDRGEKSGARPPEGSIVKPFFENLDTLRFLSFLTVFLFHVHLYEWAATFTQNPVLLTVLRVVCSGGWGVTFFFALSGFLITWLLLVEIGRNRRVDIGAFYLRRVFRIWPLYFMVMLVGMVLLPVVYRLMHQPLYFDYNRGLYAGFLSNYGVLALDPAQNAVRSYPLIMNITWSVSIEEQFYVVWPLGFLLVPRLRRLVPHAFILISIIAAIILSRDHAQMYSSSFTRIGEIAVGALFAVASFRNEQFFSFLKRMPRWFTAVIYMLAFVVIIVSYRIQTAPLSEYMLHMAGAVLFSLIIMEQNFSENSFFKFGRLKVFGFLGKISYGLYMLHPIAMFAASKLLQLVLHEEKVITEGPAFMITAFALSIIFALLSYYLIERQFLVLKDRFGFARKKVSRAASGQ